MQTVGNALAYTVVEFAVRVYGENKLAEWVKTPRDYRRVFAVSAEDFEQQ